jgi:hypothetical protein
VIGSVVLAVLIIVAMIVSCAPLPNQPKRRAATLSADST